MKRLALLLTAGLAVLLSSCESYKKATGDPQPDNKVYDIGAVTPPEFLFTRSDALNHWLDTPVRVRIEKQGRHGKVVSVITGVMSPPAGKEALLKLLKTKLGTGGALKDGNLEIQGDHREKIVAILNSLGYKAKSAGG